MKQRTRHVAQYPKHGGAACEGALKEMEGCNNDNCEPEEHKRAVNCELSEWKMWSLCSKTCGGGEKTRYREVAVEAENGGDACSGALSEMEPCNVEICPEDVIPKIEPVRLSDIFRTAMITGTPAPSRIDPDEEESFVARRTR